MQTILYKSHIRKDCANHKLGHQVENEVLPANRQYVSADDHGDKFPKEVSRVGFHNQSCGLRSWGTSCSRWNAYDFCRHDHWQRGNDIFRLGPGHRSNRNVGYRFRCARIPQLSVIRPQIDSFSHPHFLTLKFTESFGEAHRIRIGSIVPSIR